jgi:hypothetical protein
VTEHRVAKPRHPKLRWTSLLAMAALLALAGCGSVAGTSGPPSSPRFTLPPTTSSAAPTAQAARFGDAITLSNSDGSQVAVTPLSIKEVVNPSQHAGSFAALKVAVKNVGSVVYSGVLSSGAALLNHAGGETNAVITGVPGELGSLHLNPGERQVGVIYFPGVRASAVAALQITNDEGTGSTTLLWQL